MLDIEKMDLNDPVDRLALADALCQILKKLDAIPAAADTSQKNETSGAVFGHVPTIWPMVGGENLKPVSPTIFASQAFRDRFIPGLLVRAYGAGCPGLRNLASVLDLPLRKIGATEALDIRTRINEFSQDAYGSLACAADGFLRQEPGFDNYVPVQLPCAPAPSALSPVKVEPRAIAIRLPSGMTFEDFEDRLHLKLENVSLSAWIKTPEGQLHLAHLGFKSARAERFTTYVCGGVEEPSPAEELYIFRPRQDGARLVTVIERLVLEFLGLQD
ncbi:hypothetical protein [uncultured Rhodoblastus sp.]|uniref:hypothetical protein n=1 Tax=uncultured Rhodoblastus sp. TaxID=543037 RepID=UPI0025EF1D10|nr:hypothetical protein [uncultured Rhodoblastus sp.]